MRVEILCHTILVVVTYQVGGEYMPTYISLVNLTEQGVREAKNAPERLQAFDAAARDPSLEN